MQTITTIILVFCMITTVTAKQPKSVKLQPVDFTQVKIDDTFWSPRLQANRTKTLPLCLRRCEETGRISNFAKAGGLMQGKFEGIYFNDSDVYKVLEGAAYVLAADRNPTIEKKVDEIIRYITAAQQPNGYLNTYYTLVKPDKKWTDLPVRHELYCAGHLIEAAVAYFKATGKRSLLDVAIRFTDLIDDLFRKQNKPGFAGHEEIELALVKLYRLTGQERYWKLAEMFVDRRGQERIKKQDYMQAHLPVREQTDIRGHAVRAMYLYSSVADLAGLTGDPGYLKAMERIWQNVVNKKMYLTGGIGSSRKNEGFTEDYDLPNETAYCETCATIGMVLWNHRLNLLHGEGRFADVVERCLYNGLLSGVSLDGEMFFYPNPLASRGKHHRQPWYNCACCPTNIVRFVPSLGGYIYAHTDKGIWVNLYLSNEAQIEVAETKVVVRQETQYPWSGRVKLTVEPDKQKMFSLNLRIPAWCRSASCIVNDETIDNEPENGYLQIMQEWKKGEVVEMVFGMEVERIKSRPEVKANLARVAVQRGPIVYCLENADHQLPVFNIAISRSAKLTPHFRADLLGGVTVLVGEGMVGEPTEWGDNLYRQAPNIIPVQLTMIPYYAWDNRQPGQMMVWIPETVLLTDHGQEKEQ
ncbi:MAG: glycoside hydrolase family 127 protein [Planctomycetota bacterium]